jgi:hypothetical protein
LCSEGCVVLFATATRRHSRHTLVVPVRRFCLRPCGAPPVWRPIGIHPRPAWENVKGGGGLVCRLCESDPMAEPIRRWLLERSADKKASHLEVSARHLPAPWPSVATADLTDILVVVGQWPPTAYRQTYRRRRSYSTYDTCSSWPISTSTLVPVQRYGRYSGTTSDSVLAVLRTH